MVIMVIKGIFSRLKFWKRNIEQDQHKCEINPEYQLANRFKRYEKFVSEMQSIIMWDNPSTSALCVLLVNALFWLLVSLQWRFYGILSSVMLVMCVHDAWTGYVWPEIRVAEPSEPPPDTPTDPSLLAMSRMLTSCCARARQYKIWLCNLRTQQPGLFCSGTVLVCLCLWFVGRWVSGLQLIYSLLMAALLGPGLITHFVPPQLKQTLSQHFVCVQTVFSKYSANDASDDEYLPVTTSEDLALLTRASDLHHDTYDSLTNPGSSSDMASGIGLMPSHEEDSLATLSDLEPTSQLPMDPDDSDSNPDDHQIQFQSGHFNGDSSSDEEAFTRDLVFTERDVTDSAALRGLSSLIAQAVTSNLASSVGLLANVMRPQLQPRRQTRRTDTDSDLDDFEVINTDELNNQDSS